MLDKSKNKPSLRALHVISGDLWAGAEVQVFQLLREFRRSGTVAPRAVVLNPGMLANKLRDGGVEVEIFDEAQLGVLELFRCLRRTIAEWRPAVVHTHRRKEHILGGLAAWSCGVPAVATIHGRNEFAFPWWQLREKLLVAMEKFMLRYMHCRLIAVSSELANHLDFRSDTVTVVPNGIDVNEVRQAASESRETWPEKAVYTVAFLGRLVPVKRVNGIMDALSLLNASEPGAWRLWVIGDGPELQALEQYARTTGISDMVDFLGFQSNPLPLLQRADALVFASAHEGLPMTALEALSLGVPVVSPPIGGLIELIDDAGHGLVADSDSAENLAAAISGCLQSGMKSGKQAINRLPPEYTVEKTAQLTARLYSQAMKAGRSSDFRSGATQ